MLVCVQGGLCCLIAVFVQRVTEEMSEGARRYAVANRRMRAALRQGRGILRMQWGESMGIQTMGPFHNMQKRNWDPNR